MPELEPLPPEEAARMLFQLTRSPEFSPLRDATRPVMGVTGRQVVLMAFGLPLLTALIVAGSLYLGHLITAKSDRPMNISVMPAQPKIDVNVPQAPPPRIEVTAATPQVQVNVPQALPPHVTVTQPAQLPPNITIQPASPTVTVIDRRGDPGEIVRPAAVSIDSGQFGAGENPAANKTPVEPAKAPADALKPETPPTPASTPAAPKKSSSLAPNNPALALHNTPAAIDVSARAPEKPAEREPDPALVVPLPGDPEEHEIEEVFEGEILPRSQSEIARQKMMDARKKP